MHRRRRLLLLTCLACAGLSAASLPIRVYTTAQGLAHDHINRIYRDSRSFLWICTDEGLSRFDGIGFVNYTVAGGLPHIHVNDILETHAGDYWIATDGGITRFHPDGRPKRFVTYTPPGPPDALRVNAIAEDRDQSILLATSAGLYRLRPADARFEHIELNFPRGIPEAATLSSLHLDRQGILWVAAASGVYRRNRDGAWDRFLIGDSPHLYINSIAEDSDGGIWICTRQHGFGRFVGAAGEHAVLDPRLDAQAGLPDRDVRGLWFGSDGRRWAATSSGLVDWSNSRSLRILRTRDGLTDDSIYALAEDPAGNLWIGTRRGGIMRMGRSDWKTFDPSDGLASSHDAMLLETRAGEICAADLTDSRRPARCLSGDRFQTFIPPLPSAANQPPNSSEMVLQDHLDAWWMSTGRGVFRFSGAGRAADLARSAAVRMTPEVQTTRLFEDSRGDVWIATVRGETSGLLRWDRASRRLQDESHALPPQLSDIRISAFAEPAGQLWIGLGQNGGLLRHRQGRLEAVKNPLLGRISALFVDHARRLWIASLEGGLGRIDNPDAAEVTFRLFTAAQGLASNEVWCLAEDNFGRMYAGNARGVDRIDPDSGEVLRYTEADGLVQGDIRSALRGRTGDLWFLSNRGASRFHPTRELHLRPAQARITGLRVAGEPLPVSDLGAVSLGPLAFSSRQNSVTVEFGAIDYATPSELLYQYRLEGAAGGWSNPTPASSVTFANLSPGRYRFLVRSASAAGPSPSQATFEFAIQPPLWRRWWFQLLLALAAAAAAYALHRLQLERKLALERVRSHIAMDLHDDLGASLARMAVLGEVLKTNVSQNDLDSQLMLTDIADTSRRLVDGMSDIVWSIDPRHQQVADTVNRIRDFASGLLEAKGIQWKLDAAPRVLNARLSAAQRRQLYLVCKEAIHNIARHSQARHAVLRLAIEHGAFCAEIEDDGCGIPSDDGHGLGLRSMRTRAADLGGTLDIAPAAAHGTRILLRFPLRSRNA